MLVAGADEFEQDRGFDLILGDVGGILEDQQVIFVELGDGGLKRQIAPGELKLLYEVRD